MKFLRKHAEGATEGRADYWYGVIESTGGTMWGQLFFYEDDARKAAKDLGGGEVVILACRPLEDDEGEHWPLPVESGQAVAESRKAFEEVMQRAKTK